MAKRRRGLAHRVLRALLLVVLGTLLAVPGSVVALRWVDPPTSAFMVRDRVLAFAAREPGYQFRHEWRDWDRVLGHAAVVGIVAKWSIKPGARGPRH